MSRFTEWLKDLLGPRRERDASTDQPATSEPVQQTQPVGPSQTPTQPPVAQPAPAQPTATPTSAPVQSGSVPGLRRILSAPGTPGGIATAAGATADPPPAPAPDPKEKF